MSGYKLVNDKTIFFNINWLSEVINFRIEQLATYNTSRL